MASTGSAQSLVKACLVPNPPAASALFFNMVGAAGTLIGAIQARRGHTRCREKLAGCRGADLEAESAHVILVKNENLWRLIWLPAEPASLAHTSWRSWLKRDKTSASSITCRRASLKISRPSAVASR